MAPELLGPTGFGLKDNNPTENSDIYDFEVVSRLLPEGSPVLGPNLLFREVVEWKWVRHENTLPFVGVSLRPPLFSITSE